MGQAVAQHGRPGRIPTGASFLLLLLLGLACGFTGFADATGGKKKPVRCPENCLSCERVRGHIKGYPPKAPTTGRRLLTLLQARVSAAAPVTDEDTATTKTSPMRTICTRCQDGYVPARPYGTRCECAPNHAVTPESNGMCVPCEPNQVAPQGKPGKYQCTTCPPGTIPTSAGKCIPGGSINACTDRECGVVQTPEGSVLCGLCPTADVCNEETGQCELGPEGGCTPATSCKPGRVCGYENNGCGDVIPCGPPELGGNCPAPQYCNAAGTECITPNPGCKKRGCPDGQICGLASDGCGGFIECGSCNGTQSCSTDGTECVDQCNPLNYCDPQHVCGTQPNGCGGEMLCGLCQDGWHCADDGSKCLPSNTTCTTKKPNPCEGKVCGVTEDGCGNVISCGNCPDGKLCSADQSECTDDGSTVCVPKLKCDGPGHICGLEDNGCGGSVECGKCPGNKVCYNNILCANPDPICIPKKKCTKQCGLEDDNCGGVLNCGSCPNGFECTADGSACLPTNEIGNPDLNCSKVECGAIQDGAGNAFVCPNKCDVDQTCEGNKCVDVPCFGATNCPANLVCGTWTNECGSDLSCGTCPPGKVCNREGTKCVNNRPCQPATECPSNRVCGMMADGCGNLIPCGPPDQGGHCPDGTICNSDGTQCVKPPINCIPKDTCTKRCGTEDDGCGGTLTCGQCPNGQYCSADGLSCVPGQCIPKTTCDPKTHCGTQDNGCGGQIVCGTCAPGFQCEQNPGGVSNCKPTKPCTPVSGVCTQGQKCGFQTNSCGDLISCGVCPKNQHCAADGKSCEPDTPLCVPRKTCTCDKQCGTQDDGCGGVVICGHCLASQVCNAGQCKPRPIDPPICTVDKPSVCGNRICGSVEDGCGGMISCGSCSAGLECSSDGLLCTEPNQPCTPLGKCTKQCGTEPDGCGGVMQCGSCPFGQQCSDGQCTAAPTCTAIGGTCQTNSDCCWSDTDTFCEASTKKCKVKRGGKCQTNNKCGLCHPNCGSKTEPITCEAYGFTDKCNHSAAGGGGKECAQTDVCCVITKPTVITPGADGHCLSKWP